MNAEQLISFLKIQNDSTKILYNKLERIEKRLENLEQSLLNKQKTFENSEKSEKSERSEKYKLHIEEKRKKFPNYMKKWSYDEKQLVIKLFNEDKDIDFISNKLGRTENSIETILENEGLIEIEYKD